MQWLKTFAHRTESSVNQASRVLNVIGITAAGVLMLLITADVLGRYLFNKPIPATTSISTYVLVIAVYCSAAYCAVVKGHVKIDLLVSRLGKRVQVIIASITGLVSLAILSIVAWQSAVMTAYSWNIGEVSLDKLHIPAWPFRTVLVIGIAMLCMVLLVQLVRLVATRINE